MGEDEKVSLQRGELTKWKLPPSEALNCQREYPTVVLAVTSASRTETTIELYDEQGRFGGKIRFYLPTDEQAEVQKLQVWTSSYTVRRYERYQLMLWGLCKHRACETMLAIRDSHREVTAYKRKKKQQQADVP
jgi:hypothetical protein